MKTKISNLLALLVLAVAAILIENVFLQSMTINNRASDLIAKITINQLSPQNFNLMKAAGRVALADVSVPLFPGAKKLTFGDADLVRYRIDASAGKVANFYNQIMSSLGWQKVDGSIKALTAGKNLDKVIIAFAENPITKKTEAIFSTKPLSQSDIFSAASASAEEMTVNNQPQETVQPLQPIQPADNQNSQTPPPTGDNNQPVQLSEPPVEPICRINGVEVPGACAQYNSPTMNMVEFIKPDDGGKNSQPGPSEEDIKKMDERRFQDMKRGMSQFSRSITMMKRSVAKNKNSLSKCGVSIPEELINALNSSDGLVAKINGAKTADELEEAVGDIEDISSVMQDWGPRMGDLNRLCQMLKQADRDLKQQDRLLARYQKKNSAKMDISEILAEYKTNVDNMRQALVQVRELAKTDPEEALSKIEDEFYGNMDNTRNSEQAINMVLNINKGMRDAAMEIKKIENNIKSLKRKKLDTSAIEELAADFKQQIADIKSLIKTKFDAEDLIDKVETAFSALEQIYDNLQEYGLGTMAPQIKQNKSMNVNVNLPDAFKKQNNGEDDVSGQGITNQRPQGMMPQF